MEVTTPTNVVEFKPAERKPEHKPMFKHKLSLSEGCKHQNATFYIDPYEHQVTCSDCKQVVEAFHVLKMLLDRERYRERTANAAIYHRLAIEEKAEKQALKTRKAAYETLHRFGVTPEMYAAEHKRLTDFQDLALRQPDAKATPIEKAAG